MSEEKLNLYQKLAKVRKAVEVVQRNASGFGYSYVSEDELLSKITGVMDKYGISLIPRIVPETFKVEPYTYTKTKKGVTETVNEMLVQAEMIFEWVNNDDPVDKIEVSWVLVGHQSDASQAFGSSLTYAHRYFLLKYFGVATPNDDPDNWRSKQKEAEAAEDKSIASKIIADVDTKIRSYLADHPDKAEDVKKFATKFVKGGNYTTITNPALATKFANDFAEEFK